MDIDEDLDQNKDLCFQWESKFNPFQYGVDRISMELSIRYFKGSQAEISEELLLSMQT